MIKTTILIILCTFTLMAMELPKGALLEKYLLAAKKYESQGKYKKAIDSFEKIEQLHISLPKEFYYRYAINLYHNKQYRKSETYFKNYILQSTRTDTYYKSALEYLTLLEDEETQLKELKTKCKGLPKKIEKMQEECEDTCSDATNLYIDNNLYKFPHNTSFELYNMWFPKCVKSCKKDNVRPLKKEYKKHCI